MCSDTILWFRRDLRTHDHPALAAAHDQATSEGGSVVGVFVLDPRFTTGTGATRMAWVARSVLALREALDGRLVLLAGDATERIPALARQIGAAAVHVTRETEPPGAARDEQVQAALAEGGGSAPAWVETGTPYAIGPGVVLNGTGEGYRVFTPFSRAWREHGWPSPAPRPQPASWAQHPDDPGVLEHLEQLAAGTAADLPEAGERAALARWQEFLTGALEDYDTHRDRPALDGTSRMSPYLKIGAAHPRTLLADLATARRATDDPHVLTSIDTLETELAWREFYADVLHRAPESLWQDLTGRLTGMAYADPTLAPTDDLVAAWREGTTGFPIVDAGMRQLRESGWMHNRVRMITASFLCKDLHVWWPLGAAHFLDHLIDGDLASNNHGWQWVAGTGTDASPYFRVFNPVTQGLRFDPDGEYVRRWVPELRHLEGKAAHEPWKVLDGHAHGYPEPIVDHAVERREALAAYEAVRGS